MSNLEDQGLMSDQMGEDPKLDAEVTEIKKHLLSISDRDELIAAHEEIERAIIDPNQRERAYFLQGKSREAIVRARVDMMGTFRASKRSD